MKRFKRQPLPAFPVAWPPAGSFTSTQARVPFLAALEYRALAQKWQRKYQKKISQVGRHTVASRQLGQKKLKFKANMHYRTSPSNLIRDPAS